MITYNASTDRFEALLEKNANNYPRRLFGIGKINHRADDAMVKRYIKNTVIPKDRENLDEVLKGLNLKEYSEWNMYKAVNGRNGNDRCTIRPAKR
ncbi:hypothetical protein [Anaerovorax odorimutans]|uniref:hypothetical protein n=1 Tax=Anaerovorax odorimutans TaxID=109327 RepID=UPI0012EC7199|nr:hypothetical protein [Anaerovorax odorimutans]